MYSILLMLSVLVSEPFTLERVVAVVGSEPVLHSEVVTLMIESGIDEESAVRAESTTAAYREALEQIVNDKLLVEAARREGVYPTRDEIDDAVTASMEEARSGFASEQEFVQYLANMGMSLSSLRASYETILGDRIAGENFVRTRAGRVMASMPLDPVAYLSEHAESVEDVLAPRILRWIYIPVLPGNTAEAEELLIELRNSIAAGEITFSAAAVEYSQDGSAAAGGDLGWFEKGDMTATFERQVYALEPGQISDPFTTPFGVHLVKLTDRDGESVRASHILRMVPSTPSDLDSALVLAFSIKAQLDAGADFSEMASRVSNDPRTAEEGGFIGTVNVGSWDGELHRAVIDLLPGQVSEPVMIEQSMAVALFMRDNGETNWDQFEPEELQSMLQSVFWNSYYDRMVDSLSTAIPVRINIEYEN